MHGDAARSHQLSWRLDQFSKWTKASNCGDLLVAVGAAGLVFKTVASYQRNLWYTSSLSPLFGSTDIPFATVSHPQLGGRRSIGRVRNPPYVLL